MPEKISAVPQATLLSKEVQFALNNVGVKSKSSYEFLFPFYNLKMLGAVDGVATDSWAIIQGAYDSAQAAGGGTVVYEKNAVYGVSKSIIVTTVGVSTIGNGATLVPLASWTAQVHPITTTLTLAGILSYSGVSNYVCTGLKVDATPNLLIQANGIINVGDGFAGSGTPCSDFKIENCNIKLNNFHNYHIWLSRSIDFEVVGNTVDGSVTTYTAIATSQEGIECFGATNGRIHHNIVRNIESNGIFLNSGGQTTADTGTNGVQVDHNIVDRCRKGINCTPSSFTTTGAGTVTHTADLLNVTIDHNQITNYWERGIAVDNQGDVDNNTTIHKIVIDINTVEGSPLANYGAVPIPTNVLAIGVLGKLGNQANHSVVKVLNNTAVNTPVTTVSACINMLDINGIEYSGNTVINDDAHLAALTLLGSNMLGFQASRCTGATFNLNTFDGVIQGNVFRLDAVTDFSASLSRISRMNYNGVGASVFTLTNCQDWSITGNKSSQHSIAPKSQTIVNCDAACDWGFVADNPQTNRYTLGTVLIRKLLWSPANNHINVFDVVTTALSSIIIPHPYLDTDSMVVTMHETGTKNPIAKIDMISAGRMIIYPTLATFAAGDIYRIQILQ